MPVPGPCCAHLLGNLLTLSVILVGQAALSSFGLNAGSRRLNRHRRELAAGLLAHQLGPANVLEVAKPGRRGPPTFEHLGTIRQHDNVTPAQGSVLHQGSNRVSSRLTGDQLGLALLTNALLRSRRFARLVLRNRGEVGQARAAYAGGRCGLALLTNALPRSRRFARLVLRNWGRVGQACKVYADRRWARHADVAHTLRHAGPAHVRAVRHRRKHRLGSAADAWGSAIDHGWGVHGGLRRIGGSLRREELREGIKELSLRRPGRRNGDHPCEPEDEGPMRRAQTGGCHKMTSRRLSPKASGGSTAPQQPRFPPEVSAYLKGAASAGALNLAPLLRRVVLVCEPPRRRRVAPSRARRAQRNRTWAAEGQARRP